MRFEEEVKTEEVVEETPEVETQQEGEAEETEQAAAGNNFIVLSSPSPEPDPEPKVRTVGLIGDINEDKSTELIYNMLIMKETGRREKLVDPEDPEKGTKIEYDPFELFISTYGGSAFEMLSIYDTMRRVKQDCDISTFGSGKVMSAGVLLLAAGTKGKRKIGANCRVMIHDIKGGVGGDVTDLENEVEEMRWMQEKYVELLAANSDMTKNYIKKLLKKKVNVYLSATEAVELGIADEVF